MAYGQESFAVERVAATLVPFDMAAAAGGQSATKGPNLLQAGRAVLAGQAQQLFTTLLGNAVTRATNGLITIGGKSGGGTGSGGGSVVQVGNSAGPSDALYPIMQTGGLVFPYNPVISEGVSVRYDNVDIVHSNESYHAYRNTDNVRIELSNCVWTCDTFENARYALAALHFFRSYSLMDFGRGRSGMPPSPMWFSAYGNYAYYRVPVLLERAQWSFPNDIDYVGIPEPHTAEWQSQTLATNRSGSRSQKYTWMPVKFEVSSITLIVQHAPKYWLDFNLDSYRKGTMLNDRQSFHVYSNSSNPGTPLAQVPGAPSTTPAGPSAPTPAPTPPGNVGGPSGAHP